MKPCLNRFLVAVSLALACGLSGASILFPFPIPEEGTSLDECSVPRDCGSGFGCDKDLDGVRRCVAYFCDDEHPCSSGEACHPSFKRCVPPTCGSWNSPVCDDAPFCLNGDEGSLCVAESQLPPVASCRVEPARAVLGSGQSLRFEVVALGTDGQVVPFTMPGFEVDQDEYLEVDTTGVVTAIAVPEASQDGQLLIEYRDRISCAAQIIVLPEPPESQLRVVLLDAEDGSAVSGAQVVARVILPDGAAREITLTADVEGIYHADAVAGVVDRVEAHAGGYDAFTLVQPGTNDIRLGMSASSAPEMAGIKGSVDFSTTAGHGDFRAAFASLSQPALSDDFSLRQLLVSRVVIQGFEVEGLVSYTERAMATSEVFGIGTVDIKDWFAAFGRSGRRLLSVLARIVPMAEVAPKMVEMTSDAGAFTLVSLLRYVGTGVLGTHGLVGPIQLDPTPVDLHDDVAEWPLPDVDVRPQMPTHGDLSLSVPALPEWAWDDQLPTGVAVLRGVHVPTMGFSLLGGGRGYDAPDESFVADGILDPEPCSDYDPDCVRPERGELWAQFAPRHHGLEGYPLRTVVVAADVERYHEMRRGESLVILCDQFTGSSPTPLPVPAFLDFTRATYHAVSGLLEEIEVPVDADLLRIVWSCDQGRWVALLPPSASTVEELRPPPELGACAGAPMLEAIRLADEMGFQGVVSGGHSAMLALDRVTEAVSRQPVILE